MPEASSKLHYVLIDYENIRPSALSLLDLPHFNILVFVGANQKLAVDTAATLQPLGTKVEYIQMCGQGPNALDLQIAFHVGQLAARHREAAFHIVSKDTGFDPLIQHLENKGIAAERMCDVNKIGAKKNTAATPPVDAKTINAAPSPVQRTTAVVAHLKKMAKAKPATLKTLSNAVHSLFRKEIPEVECALLLDELQSKGIITVTGARVSYHLPEDG